MLATTDRRQWPRQSAVPALIEEREGEPQRYIYVWRRSVLGIERGEKRWWRVSFFLSFCFSLIFFFSNFDSFMTWIAISAWPLIVSILCVAIVRTTLCPHVQNNPINYSISKRTWWDCELIFVTPIFLWIIFLLITWTWINFRNTNISLSKFFINYLNFIFFVFLSWVFSWNKNNLTL